MRTMWSLAVFAVLVTVLGCHLDSGHVLSLCKTTHFAQSPPYAEVCCTNSGLPYQEQTPEDDQLAECGGSGARKETLSPPEARHARSVSLDDGQHCTPDSERPARATLHLTALEDAAHPALHRTLDQSPKVNGQDPPTPSAVVYSLEELLERARANNPAVQEAWAVLQAARGRRVQAGLPPNPSAGYSGQQLGSRGLAEQQGVIIEQEVITAGKLRVQRQEAAWQVRQAEQRLVMAERRVETDVRMAYYELLIAQQRVATAEQLSEVAQRTVSVVQSLLNAREATMTDYLQAKIEADSAQILLENTHAERLGAWRRLVAVVGDPTLEHGSVSGTADDSVTPYDYDQLRQHLLATHPQVAARQAEAERARWAVELAYRTVIPNINVQGIVQDDRATGSSNGALQVLVPVPIWNRNQGAIQEAWGQVAAADQAVERVILALEKRLAEVFQDYQVARQQTEQYKQSILPNAEKTLQLIEQGYRSGEFSFLQLLTAQRTYFQTHLMYLDALRRLRLAKSQIQGLLLTDSLATDP